MCIRDRYITQRFWIIDTEKGKGFDAGRAAPGRGEVLRVWNIGDKIYMASYTEGILTEYDPAERINFPENPRIVAHPPTGMRPFAHTDDGICLYYSCNHHYGNYGCVLTRYNTQTGEAFYLDDPLPLQNITSLSYSKKHGLDVYKRQHEPFREPCHGLHPVQVLWLFLRFPFYQLLLRFLHLHAFQDSFWWNRR